MSERRTTRVATAGLQGPTRRTLGWEQGVPFPAGPESTSTLRKVPSIYPETSSVVDRAMLIDLRSNRNCFVVHLSAAALVIIESC
jgi:hypothetical protein